jgi:hypothetical protein
MNAPCTRPGTGLGSSSFGSIPICPKRPYAARPNVYTCPVFVSMHVCVSAPSPDTKPFPHNAGTFLGKYSFCELAGLSLSYGKPVCPYELRPHAYTASSRVQIANECICPETIADAGGVFGTLLGVTNNRLASTSRLLVLSAWVSGKRPKRPFSPHPHEYTSPALVSAMTWSVPEATFVTLDPSVPSGCNVNKTRRQSLIARTMVKINVPCIPQLACAPPARPL